MFSLPLFETSRLNNVPYFHIVRRNPSLKHMKHLTVTRLSSTQYCDEFSAFKRQNRMWNMTVTVEWNMTVTVEWNMTVTVDDQQPSAQAWLAYLQETKERHVE